MFIQPHRDVDGRGLVGVIGRALENFCPHFSSSGICSILWLNMLFEVELRGFSSGAIPIFMAELTDNQ